MTDVKMMRVWWDGELVYVPRDEKSRCCACNTIVDDETEPESNGDY